jgi:hypothetical protein
MARIEHRRPSAGRLASPAVRRLPGSARLFAVLALVAAVVALWPVVNAWWFVQATEPLAELPSLLPTAARNAAIVALPVAVAWAAPWDAGANAWLWKGAVMAAIVQLVRYPWALVSDRLIGEALDAGLVAGGELQSVPYLVVVGVGLTLAVLSALAVWALSEGLSDAGGRLGGPVLALIAVGVLAVIVVGFGPALASAGEGLVLGLASMVSNGLFLLAQGLLAARAIAGAARRVPPVVAWRVGAIAAGVLMALPLVTLGQLLLAQFVATAGEAIPTVVLLLATYAGWPLFTLAVAMGMGRRAVRAQRRSYQVLGTPRFAGPLTG